MKKTFCFALIVSCIIAFGCGESHDEKRIREDSVSINKKPDSSFNSTNDQNANAGAPNFDSIKKADSLRK